jgi:hypothetical protein
VRYTGAGAVPPDVAVGRVSAVELKYHTARLNARRELEQYHTRRDPAAVDAAWPHLNSADRWLRYAARIAIERQDVEQWRSRALAESRPLAAATALMALARVGSAQDQAELVAALNRLPLAQLDQEPLLTALRAYALSFIRQGRPSAELAKSVMERLSPLYPHDDRLANQELCELLVYLESPAVIDRTLDLLDDAPSQEEQIHYVQALLHAKQGWSIEQRRRVLTWFQKRQPGAAANCCRPCSAR